MDIQYVGHSCFRLRGKEGLVITDPFASSVGFSCPKLSADVITVSHDHQDHNQIQLIRATSNRNRPFVVRQPGEYEIQNISVYGYPSYHDDQQGKIRGKNVMFSIFLDGVHVLHLGDLGHILDQKTVEDIPDIDVLLIPVGGVYTIDPQQALELISLLEPSYVVPMHFRTDKHSSEFAELATVDDFIKKSGKQPRITDKLTLSGPKTSDDAETQVVVLEARE